jgi:Domain of unknown function (DUF5666)
MRRALGFILAISAIAAACGGKGNPASPSEAGLPSGSVSGSATIAGAVQGAFPSTVAVAGTSVSSSVDGGGRFTLANVPAGDVQLQFSGGGAAAMLPVAAVQPAQRIDLVVSVTGSSAAIESQVRSGGGTGAELEGRVESLPPTTPALSFRAAGKLVNTDSSTRFQDGSATRTFADLRIGMRVHVKGTPSGDAINATLVELQNSQVDIPVEVNGVIDTLTGSASDFQFKIGSRVVKGDANTTFFGDGDKPDTFADLKDGVRVEVKGQQRDGFVYAVRIHINDGDDDDDNTQDSSASIQGTLKTMTGAIPTLTLTVNTTTVRTSSSTTVKRRGDFQSLDTLKVGQTLHVVGTRQSDGSIDARLIEINDDAEGGEVEIEGSVGGLKGGCPSLSFGINGYSIVTNGSTTFDGVACASMKNGDKVKVTGTKQANGSVLATRVKKS